MAAEPDKAPQTPQVNAQVSRFGGQTYDTVVIDGNRRAPSASWAQWCRELVSLSPGVLLVPDAVLWLAWAGLSGRLFRFLWPLQPLGAGVYLAAWISLALLVVIRGAGRNQGLGIYRFMLLQLGLWVF